MATLPQDQRGKAETGLSSQSPELLDESQWCFLQRRYELTARELQIADLVCRGLGNNRIAACLDIQPATVKTHIRNVYRKVRVKSKINMLLKFVREARGCADGRTAALADEGRNR